MALAVGTHSHTCGPFVTRCRSGVPARSGRSGTWGEDRASAAKPRGCGDGRGRPDDLGPGGPEHGQRPAASRELEPPMRVLLTTEATYPFHWGGLSTWCHALIQELPDVEFSLIAVCKDPLVTPVFDRPANLVDFRAVPLWGIRNAWEIDQNAGARRVPAEVEDERRRDRAALPPRVPDLRRSAARRRAGRPRPGDVAPSALSLRAGLRLRRDVPLRARLGRVLGARDVPLPADRGQPRVRRGSGHGSPSSSGARSGSTTGSSPSPNRCRRSTSRTRRWAGSAR